MKLKNIILAVGYINERKVEDIIIPNTSIKRLSINDISNNVEYIVDKKECADVITCKYLDLIVDKKVVTDEKIELMCNNYVFSLGLEYEDGKKIFYNLPCRMDDKKFNKLQTIEENDKDLFIKIG